MDKVIFWLIYDLFNYFRLKQIYCFFLKHRDQSPMYSTVYQALF